MNDDHEINKRRWNEVTPVHAASEHYGAEAFLAGHSTLGRIEREAVGDVAGKRLLHLQCHLGLDTLSWARLGAKAVGVDFSEVSVATARELARKAGLSERASFVEADVTSGEAYEGGAYDVVFTSGGTIVWLSDLEAWAATIAANLAPGGLFYFLDHHPLAFLFDRDRVEPTAIYRYFRYETAEITPAGIRDYADRSYAVRTESREFSWAIQDIFAALEGAGLAVTAVREYPFCDSPMFPDMVRGDDGYWHRAPGSIALPLLLGFKATWR